MSELHYTVKIEGFDRILYESPAHWPQCTFTMDESLSATLTIWESNIQNRQQLEAASSLIENRIRSLVLALQWEQRRPLQWRILDKEYPELHDSDEVSVIQENIIFGASVQSYIKQGKSKKPPADMPSIPVECERWILTLIEASKFEEYVEEQLRRNYLIIEELWKEFKDELKDQFHEADVNNLKLVRDFVSHAICCSKGVVDFIAGEFPSAKIMVGNKEKVAFQRNVEHRNFIAQYEYVSRQLARKLVEMKIEQLNAASCKSS